MFFRFCAVVCPLLLNSKSQIIAENSGFRVVLIFFSVEVVQKTVCIIFVQLVFPPNNGHKNVHFCKNHFALQK